MRGDASNLSQSESIVKNGGKFPVVCGVPSGYIKKHVGEPPRVMVGEEERERESSTGEIKRIVISLI